jgi:uncharacterized protein
MPNPFVHIELNTPDLERAKTFYSHLFQWELEDMGDPVTPEGAYTFVKVGKGTGGGMMTQIPNGPSGWLPYVEVDDIDAATGKAKSLGGKIMKPVTEVPGMGWFSIVQDPTGCVIGLWKNRTKE